MCAEIYGVDTTKELTPLMVRDAIVECFRQAHCEDTGVDILEGKINAVYCKEIVQKAFADVGADFFEPSKEGILKAMRELSKFSAKFRDSRVIEKHYNEIMKLVDKLK